MTLPQIADLKASKEIAAESYVIELIRQGKANKEIADIIHKTVGATENIIHRLLLKYKCRNRVQLALIGGEVPRESMET